MSTTHCPFCHRYKKNLNRHIAKCPENTQGSTTNTWRYSDPIIGSQLALSRNIGTSKSTQKQTLKRHNKYNNSPVWNEGDVDFGDLSVLSCRNSTANSTSIGYSRHERRTIQYFGNLQCSFELPEQAHYRKESSIDLEHSRKSHACAHQDSFNDNGGTADSLICENHPFVLHNTPNENSIESGTTIKITEADDQFKVIASKTNIAFAKIFDVLNQCKVPHYAYDAIIKTISSEVIKGNFDPYDTKFSRKSYIKYITSRFPTACPVPVKVRLENRWNMNNNAGTIRNSDQVEVITYSFTEQLEDLLSDQTLFGDLDNLVINRDVNNPDNKWMPYSKTENQLYEVLDGAWYQEYAKHQVKDPRTEFCFPIGLYIDASETVTYGRYSFQPLVMFPLVLNLKTRNRNTSSRVIALIPDLDAKSSAIKAYSRAGGKANIGTSIRNYHQCMQIALESLKAVQRSGGLRTYLRLGNDVRHLTLKCPVAFILGDAKSQDTLCGRFLSRNTNRMCRACNVSFESSHRAGHKCTWIVGHKYVERINTALNTQGCPNITSRETRAALKSLHRRSVHAVSNAFFDLDFGGFPRGVYGCTPHDLMHLFLEGVLKYCTRLFVNRFNTSQKAAIDTLVCQMFDSFRSSEKRNIMPRASFIKGMTNLTMITADEEAGMALTLLIIGMTDTGRGIFDQQLDDVTVNVLLDECEENTSDFDDEEQPTKKRRRNHVDDDVMDDDSILTKESFISQVTPIPVDGNGTYRAIIEVIEMMLSFYSWYKSEKHLVWNENSKSGLQNSIREMIRSIKFVLPRYEGNGWCIQKLHELLHISEDVANFGSPKNFDTGIYENRLIYIGKDNAKFCQKRGPCIFTRQLGERIYEQQCFEKAKRLFFVDNIVVSEHPELDDDDHSQSFNEWSTQSLPQPPKLYPSFRIENVSHCKNPKYTWLTNKTELVPDIIIDLLSNIMLRYKLPALCVYSEINVKGNRFRCHPNYQSRGPWYDWAIVQFKPNSSDRRRFAYNKTRNILSPCALGQRPVKILGFFYIDGEMNFLFHRTEDKISSDEDSALAERWKLEYDIIVKQHDASNTLIPKTEHASVMQIVDSAFVVEEKPGLMCVENNSNIVVLVKKKDMWSDSFTDATC